MKKREREIKGEERKSSDVYESDLMVFNKKRAGHSSFLLLFSCKERYKDSEGWITLNVE